MADGGNRGRKLYIGNLNFNSDEAEIEQAFEEFGVEKVDILRDKESGRSRGFGFVLLQSADQIAPAIENMNQSSVGGRNITVALALDKTENRGGGGRRERGGRGGGGGYGGGGRSYGGGGGGGGFYQDSYGGGGGGGW